MINLGTDTVLSLSDAARWLPPVNGRRPHTATIWRWASKGINGIRLETARIGRRVITSAEALQRFTSALAERPTIESKAPPSPALRTRSMRDAERRLVADGVL